MRNRHFILALALSFLVGPQARARVLDPQGAKDEILESVVDALDGHDIDVLYDWKSNVALGDRPRVAPLSGFPTSALDARVRAKTRTGEMPPDWMKAFTEGSVGFIVAVPKHVGATDTFSAQWNRTPKSKRMFLSFTKEDHAMALKVASAFEQQGFCVFTYIGKDALVPHLAAEEAGEYFKSAGRHYVVDTEAARKSIGVGLEAALIEAEGEHVFVKLLKWIGFDDRGIEKLGASKDKIVKGGADAATTMKKEVIEDAPKIGRAILHAH